MMEVMRVIVSSDGDVLAYQAEISLDRLEEYKRKLLTEDVTWGSVHLHSDSYGGFADWHKIGTYQVVTCRACHLRIKVPNSVRTIRDLIEWADSAPQKAERADKEK